jgi:nitrogen fixation NifU-like protein
MPLDIYAEEIISQYEHPHNKGKLPKYDVEFHDENPICGDDITIYVKIENDKIAQVSFEGQGCAISQAGASMLTDFVKGMPITEANRIDYDKIKAIIGLDPGPARMHCAVLSMKALSGALKNYMEHKYK